MWNPQRIALISPLAIQKRLPFAISLEEVSNFIGNFSLSPEATPATNRTKYILHALIKELLIQEKISVAEGAFVIPDYILPICANETEACMIALDSILLPDICEIKNQNNIDLATLLQIHPVGGVVKGTVTLDFGLAEKQIIHITPQSLVRIPIPTTLRLKITLHLTEGKSTCPQGEPILLKNSPIGFIIDTRESDVLLKSDGVQAKNYAVQWLQSFDIPTSDI